MEKIQSSKMLRSYQKANAQLEDVLHKTTKQFVDWCLENEVNHVVIGNPEGVQRNTKKKRRKRSKSKIIQLVFWKSTLFTRHTN